MCDACWAFSTVETVETMYAFKKGVLQPLSVQEVVDCAKNGNMGRDRGDSCNLVEWLVMNNVSIQQKEYLLAWQTQVCTLTGKSKGVQVAPNLKCNYLVRLLVFHGPMVVPVNAIDWQNYLGGVVQFHCDEALQTINHAVQLVGYDRGVPVPFYISRNSWGPDFGDEGYIYLAAGMDTCGLGTEVVSLDVLCCREDHEVVDSLITLCCSSKTVMLFQKVKYT